MATQDDVRRLALELPESTEDVSGFRFFVAGKQFIWSWLERIDPKRARVSNAELVAVSVAAEFEKEA